MSATVEQLRKGVASLLFAALMRCIAQLPMLGSNAAAEMALQSVRNTRPGNVARMIRRATGCMHACKAAHWVNGSAPAQLLTGLLHSACMHACMHVGLLD